MRADSALGDYTGVVPHIRSLVALLAVGLFAAGCGGSSGTANSTPDSAGPPPPTPNPTLSLSAAPLSIEAGESTTLTWSSSNATSCSASGAWAGDRATSGSVSVSPAASATYTLSCSNGSAGVTRSATVAVGTSNGDVQVDLSATQSQVVENAVVTLTWSSVNADACQASGGWQGSLTTSGSQVSDPLTDSTTFSITCTAASGSASSVAMTTVQVVKNVTVAWDPPTISADGSELEDLAGYRVYTGGQSGNYGDSVTVTSPGQTERTLVLEKGNDHFVAVTAFDTGGNESGFSEEISIPL